MEQSVFVLTGIKHCGKSTAGKEAAERLSLPFFDTDDLIRSLSGKTPRELYNEGGEKLFRQRETEACSRLADGSLFSGKALVAAGGGLCDNEEAAGILKKNGIFFYLKTPEETLLERILYSARQEGELPAYIARQNPQNENDIRRIFHEIYTKRACKYAILADRTIDTAGYSIQMTVDVIIEKVYEQYNGNPAGI